VIGLPSLQAMDRSQGARIWMASEATDMRCGFDRLAERVSAVVGENPQSGHLFVFRSRRGDRLNSQGIVPRLCSIVTRLWRAPMC